MVNYTIGWKWCPNVNNWFAELFMEDYFVGVVTTIGVSKKTAS
jgi:hypothetical protein